MERKIGGEAMSLYVLDAILWILGIRGHIPQDDGWRGSRGGSPFAANTNALMRVLAAVVVSVVVLSLALWAAVWLAIRLL
jgi:hypothetical protein